MCKTGSAAGKCAGAKSNTVRRRSNHARTEDQTGREKRANTDASGDGGCTPQSIPQDGTLQQDPNTSASCAKGTYGPGQLQGRAGMGQHKPWQQQRGHDRPETPPVTPPPRGPTQSTPGRGHPGEGQVLQSRRGQGYTDIPVLCVVSVLCCVVLCYVLCCVRVVLCVYKWCLTCVDALGWL